MTRRSVSLTSSCDPRLSPAHRRVWYGDADWRVVTIVPLVAADAVVGLVELADDHPRDISAKLEDLRDLLCPVAESIRLQVSMGAAEPQAAEGDVGVATTIPPRGEGLVHLVPRPHAAPACPPATQVLHTLRDIGQEARAGADQVSLVGRAVDGLLEITGAVCCTVGKAGLRGMRTLVHRDVRVDRRGPEGSAAEPADDVLALGVVVAARETVHVRDADDPRLTPHQRRVYARQGLACHLSIPLLTAGRLIGVVVLGADRKRAFGGEAVDAAQALGCTLAWTIAQADLHDALEQRAREADLVDRVAAVTAVSLDAGDIATAAVSAIAGLTPFDDVYVATRSIGVWRVVYSSLPDVAAVSQALDRLSEPPLAERLWDERAVLIDLEHEPLLVPAAGPEGGHRSALVAGLWVEDRLSGALVLASRQEQAFSDADRRLFADASPHLALAFHSAMLAESRASARDATLELWTFALKDRDPDALGRAARVAGYLLLLGRDLGWPDQHLSRVTEATLLHDVVRLGLRDDAIRDSAASAAVETPNIRGRAAASERIVGSLFSPDLARALRLRHERWDGGGYPAGLAGQTLPEVSRALRIIDFYDSLAAPPPLEPAPTLERCVAEVRARAGTWFDPAYTAAFVRVLERLAARRGAAQEAADRAAACLAGVTLERCAGGGEHDTVRCRLATLLEEERAARPAIRRLTLLTPTIAGWSVLFDTDAGPAPQTAPALLADEAALRHGSDRGGDLLAHDASGLWVRAVAEAVSDGDRTVLVCADVTPADDWPDGLDGRSATRRGSGATTVSAAAARLGQARLDARRDDVTGLYDPPSFRRRLAEEVVRAAAQGEPLAVLSCEIDDVPESVPWPGRSARDETLRAVAAALTPCLRSRDLATRRDDRSFTIALSATGPRGASETAERIRRGVSAIHPPNLEHPLTLSVGIAVCPRDATLGSDLLDMAARALHAARRLGGGRVVAFDEAHHGS